MARVRYELYSTLNQRLIDAVGAGFAFYLAYQLRFDWRVPASSNYQLWLLLPFIMFGQVLVTSSLGLYRLVWRYIGLADALILSRGYILFTGILLIGRYGLPAAWSELRVPLTSIVAYFVLALGAAIAVRVLRRLQYEGMPGKAWNGSSLNRVLLIGAGGAGAMLAKEIACKTDLKPVGFLDDDPKKLGSVISGLRVLGPIQSLVSVVADHKVNEVIICIAKAPTETLKRVWALCEAIDIRPKIVPSFEEILHGRANIAAYREVEFSDLLGREPLDLSLDDPKVLTTFRGRRVLVTGAGGSIGSELACQLAALRPQELILLDKDENGLNDTCVRLRSLGTADNVHPVVADLRFTPRLEEVLSRYRPEIVFHAAAHKHVYLMEMNPCEAVLNNVFGTRSLIEQGLKYGMGRFVLISTDKAVKPSCIMGATKRLCEMLVQSQCAPGKSFCCVRFGNVIGSRGSVVPIFQKQIARGQAITLTHPDAERYLMTIPEAVRLLIQAGTLGARGEIFVLDMGQPVRIANLARHLIELSGLRPGFDIPIQVTALQKGEKLSEELLDPNCEKLVATRFEKVGAVKGQAVDFPSFAEKLEILESAAWQGNPEGTLRILRDFGIGFGEPPAGVPSRVEEPAPVQREDGVGALQVTLPSLATARP